MSARDHLHPQLFDPGPALSAEEQDRRVHSQMGRELATFGEVQVSLPHRRVDDIVRTGDIRTQFETQDSEGAYYPALRQETELVDLGYSGHPVYGAVARGPDEPTHYGDVVFHLDSSVKDRSTMFPSDSLNIVQAQRMGLETGMQDLSEVAPAAEMRKVSEGKTDPIVPPYDESYESEPYIEAHIHPGRSGTGQRGMAYAGDSLEPAATSRVPFDQVRRATIHDANYSGDLGDIQRQKQFRAGEQLSGAGIPVDHVMVDNLEQPALPMQYHDGPTPSSIFSDRRRLVPHEKMTDRDKGTAP